MQIRSKAIRYLLYGIAIDLIIVLGLVVLVIVSALISYDGKCPNFIMMDSAYRICSLTEYVESNLTFAAIIALILWWLVLPALLVPPLGGLALGLYKSRSAPESTWPVNNES